MMRSNFRPYATGLCIVLVAVALQLSAFGADAKANAPRVSAAVPASQCFTQHPGQSCSPWHIVAGASGVTGAWLRGVAAVSASNVWAVGSYTDPTTGAGDTLAEQWNGSSWALVPSPNPPTSSSSPSADLNGIVALSASDIWAVGYYFSGLSTEATLIEHWDGSTWSVVSSPNVPNVSDELTSVAASSASDIWAVGMSGTEGGTAQTLIEHWNGSAWSIVSSADANQYENELNGVTAVSSTDAWAVGYYVNATGTSSQVLIEHWDGSSWSIWPLPTTATNDTLNGIAETSSNNVWAVGSAITPGVIITPLAEHWNGMGWSVVPYSSVRSSLPPDGSTSFPTSVFSAASATPASASLWAVGYTNARSTALATFTSQWTGTTWLQSPSPNVGYGTVSNHLSGVAAVSASEAWAVGYTRDQSGNYATLILHYVNTGSPPPWTRPTSSGSSLTPTTTPGTVTPGGQGASPASRAHYWWRLRRVR